jgi:ATP-dependent Clp protease adaptor protein ClpS
MADEQTRRGGAALAEKSQKTARPRRWKVLLHNDDYTTMEFVIEVLTRHFGKSHTEATHIMLQVHHKGVGVAGAYPRDLAETKAATAMDEAREHGMPLKLTTEPE